MSGGFVGSMFSRMFLCAPSAPPEQKKEADDGDFFISEVSGTEELIEKKPLIKSTAKVSKSPRKEQRRPSREIEKRREGESRKSRNRVSEESSEEPERKRSKNRYFEHKESTRPKHSSKSGSKGDRKKDSEEKKKRRSKGRKVKDIVRGKKEANNEGHYHSEDTINGSRYSTDDEAKISRGIEDLLMNPPMRGGGYSTRASKPDSRERSSMEGKSSRKPVYNKSKASNKEKRDESTNSSTEEGSTENMNAKEPKQKGSSIDSEAEGDVQLISSSLDERRSPVSSTESLRNSIRSGRFGNVSKSVDSEVTREGLEASEYSNVRSSDNETDVSYMIDFYDKIHFNRILAKRMANFLNRKKK